MTKVIQLFGAPSSGKSTLAAELFVYLKKQNKKVEIVSEYAKEFAWQNRNITDYEQIHIIGEQIRRESLLYGKVDYLITDSPSLYGAYFLDKNHKENAFITICLNLYDKHNNVDVEYRNYFIKLTDTYDTNGRFETKHESHLVQKELLLILDQCGIKYEELPLDYSLRLGIILGNLNL